MTGPSFRSAVITARGVASTRLNPGARDNMTEPAVLEAEVLQPHPRAAA